jgi:hypothetical protein
MRRAVELRWKDCVVTVNQMLQYILNDFKTDFQSDLFTLLDLQPDPTNPIQQLPSSKEEETITALLQELKTNGEDVVQGNLLEQWIKSVNFAECYGADTSTTSRHVPIYKVPDAYESSASGSAMVDIVSTACPMVLELKSSKSKGKSKENLEEPAATTEPDEGINTLPSLTTKEKELVYQLIERIFTMGRMNETLRRIVGFATSGRRSWILLLLRDFDGKEKEKWKLGEKYYLSPIETSQIVPMWHRLNRASVLNKTVYCDPQRTYPLAELLNALGYHPGYCQMKWLKHSATSDIFSVTPADLLPGKKELSLPKSNNVTSMIVKLSNDPRGIQEVNVLKHLSPKDNICPAILYVIATAEVTQRKKGELSVHLVNDTFLLNNHLNPKFSVAPKLKSKAKAESALHVEKVLSKNVADRFADCYFCKCELKDHASKKSLISADQWWNYCRDTNAIPVVPFTGVVMYMANRRVRDAEKAGDSYTNRLTEIHKRDVLHCDIRPPNCLFFDIPKKIQKKDDLYEDLHYFITDFDLSEILTKKKASALLKLVPGNRTRLIEDFRAKREKNDPLEEVDKIRAVKWDKEIELTFFNQIKERITAQFTTAVPPGNFINDSISATVRRRPLNYDEQKIDASEP